MTDFCSGNTSGHCGFGCQSGPCLVETTVSPAPGPSPAPITGGGSFAIIGNSGVPAMHAALMPNGRVVFLDKIEDYTQLKLANGQYAYSSEFDPATNAVVPLAYKTNAFCSGGTFLANGDLLAIGGNGPLTWIDPTVGDGFNGLRYLSRSSSNAALNGKDWSEPGNKLKSDRWYPSAQTLPDGRVFVASGSINGLDPTNPVNNACNYEILSATGVSVTGLIPMDILLINQPYYMYPFMHLLKDGNIFIFTARSSQIFNINGNNIVKALPNLPGDYRTYPNTGGSVLFPLSSSNNWSSKIIICGGGAYQDITSPTDPSCGVISPEDANPTWEMDSMPQGRVMVEGTLLPDGTIIWLNGANLGAQGFGLATDPTFSALHYDPTMALGKRFTQLASSTVPRMYHSVALLLLDGTLLVTGGNPTEMPSSQTQWAVERFTPPYLMGANAGLRPTAVTVPATVGTGGTTFKITFTVPVSVKTIKVTLYHGGFVTHSVHMGHRMLFLDNTGFQAGKSSQTITVTTPPNKNVAPPGPYVIYVLVSTSSPVQAQNKIANKCFRAMVFPRSESSSRSSKNVGAIHSTFNNILAVLEFFFRPTRPITFLSKNHGGHGIR